MKGSEKRMDIYAENDIKKACRIIKDRKSVV